VNMVSSGPEVNEKECASVITLASVVEKYRIISRNWKTTVPTMAECPAYAHQLKPWPDPPAGGSQPQTNCGPAAVAMLVSVDWRGIFSVNPYTNGPIEGMVPTNNMSACDRVAMEHVAECGWTAENPGSGQGLAMASIGGRMRGTQP
jgi:hypothetical protein